MVPDFYYIPGTDTCIKLGGYLRAEVAVNTNNVYGNAYSGASAANNRFTNDYTWRSREDLNIDTRTATEYGVVRTFFDATFTWTTAPTVAQPLVRQFTMPSVPVQPRAMRAAATWPAARSASTTPSSSSLASRWVRPSPSSRLPGPTIPATTLDALVGGGGTITGVNQFSYTAEFGNGVSGTHFGAGPDRTTIQAGVDNLGSLSGIGVVTNGTGTFGASDYAGTMIPDFVGMLRVDQAWGLFQASVAAHDNHAGVLRRHATAAGTAFPVLNSLAIPTTSGAGPVSWPCRSRTSRLEPGTRSTSKACIPNGATRYNIQDLGCSAGAATIYGGTSGFLAYQSVGIGCCSGYCVRSRGQQQLTQTWGFRGAFTHNWDPFWNTSIYGAWASVKLQRHG